VVRFLFIPDFRDADFLRAVAPMVKAEVHQENRPTLAMLMMLFSLIWILQQQGHLFQLLGISECGGDVLHGSDGFLL
jgi:hypothetical protein